MKCIISQKSSYKLKLVDILFVIMLIVNLALPNMNIWYVRAIFIIMFECYIMIFGFYKKKGNTRYHIIWGISFFIYAFLSLNWAKYPQGVYDQINNVFWALSMNVLIAHYIVVYNVKLQNIAKQMILCLVIIIVNTIITGQFNISDLRLTIGINENTYGKILSNIGCLILTYAIIQKERHNLIWIIPIIILVFLSGSRKAFLSCIFYIIYLFSQNGKKNILHKTIIVSSGVFVFYILVIKVDFFHNIIGHRLVSMINYFNQGNTVDGSLVSRINMIKLAWNLFKVSPVFGIGLNNFKYYVYYNTYTHNNYLELLCGLGIVGLMLYYLPILIIYGKMLSLKKKLPVNMIMPIAIVTMFFILDVGNVSYFSLSDHIFLGIAIGYYYQAKLQYKIDIKKKKHI